MTALDQLDITTPEIYVEHGYPWAAWAQMRREAPVYWYDRPTARPHWAFTRYQDIQELSRNPGVFSSATRLTVDTPDGGGPGPVIAMPDASGGGMAMPSGLELMINMDPPKHGEYRNLVSRNFTPRAMRLMGERIDEIAAEVIDRAAAHVVDTVADRVRLDFVSDVAAKLPMAAISELLGVPRDQWDDLYRWTNQLIGAGDPE